ncbi:hypothetical protein [Mesomycoplasma neurolyticum]|uniref:Uncharacterized protein n=1 Tax=Mesomycoplasma neurolyticum TaxID=2120 RepID=A0A449A6L8_9BACT|nr:hypothetical protein [Mesomycoplasma neurolyticum]VEU59867.1 Uncharacterised protein [Mesomycoplasma neurolyticum]
MLVLLQWNDHFFQKNELEIIAGGISERIGISDSFLTMEYKGKKTKKQLI